ncbi:MAG TPA: sugar phosphate isomerase/epimerase family protein [Clostridiaceae bacterium]
MRFGICTGLENLKFLEKSGFDYLEWSLNLVAARSKIEFREIVKKLEDSSIKCEAMNCFFPPNIKVVGPDINESFIKDYIKKALDRSAQIDTKVLVLGGGGQRSLPDGWDKKTGYDQFVAVLEFIGTEAAQYGITIVLEPLNASETNLVKSIKEGLLMVKGLNNPNVKLLADFYHMRRDNECMEDIDTTKGWLKHIHIANSNGRVFPGEIKEDDYTGFFNALKRIDYEERISIEASTSSFEVDATKALILLKEICK